MGRLVLFLSLPISRAAAARWLINSTSLRSISSIFLRQSSIVISLTLRLRNRLPNAQSADKVCHGLRGIAPMLLHNGYDCTADYRCIGKFADGLKLFRIRDAESDCNRQRADLADAGH